MTMSVYLSNEVRDILSCYGTLDEVVDKILIAGSQGIIDIMEKPSAPEKRGGSNYQINIQEPDYIELVETYGAKSSKISLRRLLYWFVENEMYDQLGWEPREDFAEERHSRKYDAIVKLKQALFNAKQYFPEHAEYFDMFKNLITETEDEIWYAK